MAGEVNAPLFAREATGLYAARIVREIGLAGKRRMGNGGVAIAFTIVLLALGVATRLHNAWTAPILAGYDAFSHFTYIWYFAETGRVPVASQGWSYFHPPLYYAFQSLFWRLSEVDPVLRLRLGTLVLAAVGCLHALLAWRVVGRRFPGDLRLRAMAAALPLFVPVMLYSAGFLGNEGMAATLCSLALFALLRTLALPSVPRAVVLGLCLGLAMLAKFTAIIVVATSAAALVLRSLASHRMAYSTANRTGNPFAHGFRALAISMIVALAVCGPYYARNIEIYGTPFRMAREVTFLTSYVEGNQPQAARGWADYLTFDPLIFRRPVWPRGASPLEDSSAYGLGRSMRESVWTGLYANTWFDGFGGWVLPPVTESEAARRAGQALLLLGLVPTGLVMAGAWFALGRLRRDGWDDAIVVFGLVSILMLALFVFGTRSAPIAAAVKATYFTPICLAFAFWFALGLAEVQARRPRWMNGVTVLCVALAVLSVVVFWQGLVFGPQLPPSSIVRYEEARRNQFAVVLYAGGQRDEARAIFETLAASEYHLAVENLAWMEVDAGHLREGLALLQRAAQLQRDQADGGPIGRERFLALAEAEYDHSMAVVLSQLHERDRAEELWHRALKLDPEHGEAMACLGISQLESAIEPAVERVAGDQAAVDRVAVDRVGVDSAAVDRAADPALLSEAVRTFADVRLLDPGLEAGWVMGAVVDALAGNCTSAKALIAEWRRNARYVPRRFLAEVGNGAGLSASIGRRRQILPSEGEASPNRVLAKCAIDWK